MEDFYNYIEGVRNGSLVVSNYIKLAVDRLEKLKQREDVYFDTETVEEFFAFLRQMKHYTGKSVGQPFELLPFQK